MSETAERETELVAGVIGGITQKKADTWTVQVTPEGSNYAKNLWTKDADLVESLATKIGQMGAFVGSLGAPYTVQGKEVRSWWIDHPADGTENLPHANVSPLPAAKGRMDVGPKPSTEGMTKEEWARKDSAIHKMACIKTAADALKHTIPTAPFGLTGTAEDRVAALNSFSVDVLDLANRWHRSVLAERDDPAGEDVPF